jgi:succinyl-diaminopimelate desuccinylase
MTIDFKKEVQKRKAKIIEDLQNLLRINSELTTFDPKRKGAPFGEGTKEALDFMLSLGQKDGFEVVNLEGYAGHIEYGKQKDFIGMIGHLDVVPAGKGWQTDPYGAEIINNRIYARGAEDDKGPTIAAYYALKIIKELELPLSKRIKLILGNDEETAWRCMRHYFSVYPEAPVAGFIPDADFPLIYAEKGISRLILSGREEDERIISLHGGLRDNMVPDEAVLVMKKDEQIKTSFNTYLKAHHLEGELSEQDDTLKMIIQGKSAHGSTPELGVNAIDLMINFMNHLGIKNNMIDLMTTYLVEDYLGKKLHINYNDPEMGDLTNNFGVLKYENNVYEMFLNLRYPNGVSFEHVTQKISEQIQPFKAKLIVDNHQKLIYKDPSSPFIQTLLEAYQKHTNDYTSKPITIGGGTFARAMPNSVAFGPQFPGHPSYIHQKDEYTEIEDLLLATTIYAEALYALAK